MNKIARRVRGKKSMSRRKSQSTQKTVLLYIDEDVLQFFKQQGHGYLRRMNAVWRSYMQQKRKKRA
jgi:uncharacterized protein (DUF4415 family)